MITIRVAVNKIVKDSVTGSVVVRVALVSTYSVKVTVVTGSEAEINSDLPDG